MNIIKAKPTQYKVYDRNGKFRHLIEKAQEKQIADDEWLRGVTCFVINEKKEVLIEKRVKKGLTPGKLDFCSGHIDGEETETQAMIRELGEELDIPFEEAMNVVKITPEAIKLKFESSGKIKNFFITFYCLKRKTSEVKIQEEEVEKIVWLPLGETFELVRSGRTKFPNSYDYSNIFAKVIDIINENKEVGKVQR